MRNLGGNRELRICNLKGLFVGEKEDLVEGKVIRKWKKRGI